MNKDVLVVGSDGLFDNLYNQDVLDCLDLEKQLNGATALASHEKAAVCLADKSEEYSYRKDYFSPFAKGAKESGKRYMGGKDDDITVIVGEVVLSKTSGDL